MKPSNHSALPLSQIDPFVIRSARNLLEPGFSTGPRTISHYQLQYIQEGEGTIRVNDREYAARKGALFFWGPNTPHQITSDVNNPLIILGLQFHFVSSGCPVRFTDFPGYPTEWMITTQARIDALLLDLANEYALQRLYWQETANSLCRVLLLLLARQIQQLSPSTGVWETTEQILRFMQEHYHEPLTNDKIAKAFHFHPSYVNKLISIATGQTLHQYLVNIRINQAVDKLYTTNLSIQEVAESVGYANIHHFSRLFKKKMGVSPSELRSTR
ncbi:AraC family transcriptional regulator [Paenibacillus sp. HB172176]|uniref:AraC family transcriptional regulator n=1 Tax=Paenibacillus sp. HB172176 TaxID=2493690 RepID=UPI001439BABB|nr:AraC family transcriptional regulator [Paenibacillus sp. HB172176]